MKPTRALLALIFAVTSLAVARPVTDANWVAVAPAGGRFKAQFPKEPVHLEQTIEHAGKSMKAHFFVHSTATSGALGVIYMDLPLKAGTKEMEKAGLREAVRRLPESLHAEVVDDKDFEFGKYTAKSVLCQKQNGLYIQLYMIIVGTRLYEVMGAGASDELTSAPFKRFFDSFQITK